MVRENRPSEDTIMTLSALAINTAKPKDKPYKLTDGSGLYLLVMPTGGRLWRFNYRFDGKQKTLAFGNFPDLPLAKARDMRASAREALALGKDPAEVRRENEREAKARSQDTFDAISTEWLDKLERDGRSTATMTKMRWLVDFARPALGRRPITELTAPELLEVLRVLEGRGRLETANRLRSTFGTIFRYAIATGRARYDVSANLKGALVTPKPKHHAAILDPQELGSLLRAIDAYDGQPAIRLALCMAPHVFVRPGELRCAEWPEFNVEKRIWTIPAHKTKMRRPHRVPLTAPVLAILEDLRALSLPGPYLFPSVRSDTRPITDNTLNAAMRRMGYGKDEVTAHGFRATASTLLNETGQWHPDAIERQLAHVDSSEVRRAYARGEHWEERVRMMKSWSDELLQSSRSRPLTVPSEPVIGSTGENRQ
jgi:integrase